jgi:serine/threonine protein kinase
MIRRKTGASNMTYTSKSITASQLGHEPSKSEIKMDYMMEYVDHDKFLKYIINSQREQQDLMSEQDDFKIFENVRLNEFEPDLEDTVQHRLVLDKMSNRYFMMTKINWEKFKNVHKLHKNLLQDMLIADNFAGFPHTIQIKRIFIDDLTDREKMKDPQFLWKFNMNKVYLYQIRDLCPYGTLETLIQQAPNKRLNEKAAKFYAGEIVFFLYKAHSIGLYHKRICPANILIYQNLHLKISNF